MSERSEEHTAPAGPHHPPMLERYLGEEDRLQKFFARPKEHRTPHKERFEGKAIKMEKRSKTSEQVNEGCGKLRATDDNEWHRTEARGEGQ